LLVSSSQGPSSTVLVTEKVTTPEITTELTTERPITTEKVTTPEVTTELTTEHPITTEKVKTQEPSTEQSSTEQPSTKSPFTEKQSTKSPSTEQPSTEQSSTVTRKVETKTIPVETTRVTDVFTDPPSSTLLTDIPTTLEQETSASIPIETTTILTEKPSTAESSTSESSTLEPSTTTIEPSTKMETTHLPSTRQETKTPKIESTRPPSTLAPTTTEEPSTTTELIIYPCPSFDWVYEEGECYYGMVSNGWEKDEKKCIELDAHLVSIHDKTQNSHVKFISHKAPKTDRKIDVSIGLHEVKVNGKREWQWTDNSKLNFTNWADGYSKTPTGDLKCATYFTETKNPKKVGLWRYTNCDEIQSQAVCMQKANFDHYPTNEKLFKFNQNGNVVERRIPRNDRHRIKTRL